MDRSRDNPNSLATKLKHKGLQSQLHRFISGEAKEPRRTTLQPVAEFYDVPVEAFYEATAAAAAAKRLRLEDGDGLVLPAAVPEPPQEEECVIKQYDVAGSMGVGLLLKDQPGVIRSVHVTREWVEKNVPYYTGLDNLAIVTGFGDSMLGMYNPGDPLLVDRGITKCDVDGVYFFRVGEEGFIKRLQRIPGQGVIVISENPKYRDWTITPDMDFQVLAKVLIAWNGHKL
jgi:phage repressor protein C with HTH and peptisase S24 domain